MYLKLKIYLLNFYPSQHIEDIHAGVSNACLCPTCERVIDMDMPYFLEYLCLSIQEMHQQLLCKITQI